MNRDLSLMYLDFIRETVYSIETLIKERGCPSFTPDKTIKLQCAYYRLFALVGYIEKEMKKEWK